VKNSNPGDIAGAAKNKKTIVNQVPISEHSLDLNSPAFGTAGCRIVVCHGHGFTEAFCSHPVRVNAFV
jgi:hypothetical protein